MRTFTLFVLILFTLCQTVYTQQEFTVPLPEGHEYSSWDNTTYVTKTYIVDQAHPNASDENPGTADRPFRTINHAAQVVEPGERVLVKAGVYRERIEPHQGGTGADNMVIYQAAPGARVVIKGSRVLNSEWERSIDPHGLYFSRRLWMTSLPDPIFEYGYFPFKTPNASAEDIGLMPWAEQWTGRVPYTLSRGIIFQNGRRMRQITTYEDLVRIPGSFWVDTTGTQIHIHPYRGQEPENATFEVTVQQHIIKPPQRNTGYICIKGFVIEHAGNGFPRTGVGAVFTNGGHHWLIEDNTIRHVNSVAVEIGARTDEAIEERQRVQNHPGGTIVRNNTIYECGTGGVQGLNVTRALVEQNHIYDIGWQDVERYWECAGIKLLVNTQTLVRRNHIHDILAGCGVWLDWNNKHSRVTQNLFHDINSWGGAVYIEASRVPNWVDNNVLWDIDGYGINLNDTDNAGIMHNLIVRAERGINSRVNTDRSLQGRPMTSEGNSILNNIFMDILTPVYTESENNTSDYNVFVDPKGLFDLNEWQQTGWDRNSRKLAIDACLNKKTSELTWHPQNVLPNVPATEVDEDYWNIARPNADVIPGPFSHEPVKEVTYYLTDFADSQ